MRVPNIKEVMHDPCMYLRYESGNLWYQISYTYHSDDKAYHALFDFPIPVNDTGEGTFGLIEKPVTLMRWLRKHIEYLNSVIKEEKEEQAAGGEW